MWLCFNNFIDRNSRQAKSVPRAGHSLLIPALENHTSLSIFRELINLSSEVIAIKCFISDKDNQASKKGKESHKKGILEI